MTSFSEITKGLADTRKVQYYKEIHVTLRPMPNPDLDAYMAKLMRPMKKGFRHGMGENDLAFINMTKEAMAHTVVTNIEGADDITFSAQWCATAFRDPKYYDLFSFCRTEASNIAEFFQADEEDKAKN